MRWANLAKAGTAGVVISMRDIGVSLVSEEWNERDALAPLQKRQELGDRLLEMLGLLVCLPASLVDIEFEDEEQRRIGRRLVRQEELHAWLRLGQRREPTLDFQHGVDVAFVRLEHDRHDEALVQGGQRFLWYPVRRHSSLLQVSRLLWTPPPDNVMSVVKCAVPTGFSTSSSGCAPPPGRPPQRPWRRRSR